MNAFTLKSLDISRSQFAYFGVLTSLLSKSKYLDLAKENTRFAFLQSLAFAIRHPSYRIL